jgi:hypothetical protein
MVSKDNIKLIYGTVVITNYASIIYKTSNGRVGETAHNLQKNGPFGRSGKFTNSLVEAGPYVNNGLNTNLERERVIDNSKDWMLKN